MKPSLVFFLLLLQLPKSFGQMKDSDITGLWLNDQENAHILIYQKGGAFFGKLIWVKQDNEKEPIQNDSDRSKRSKDILGMDIISDLVFDGETWKKGTLYVPKKDREVNCEALLSDSKDVLTLKITKLWYSASIKWTRIQ